MQLPIAWKISSQLMTCVMETMKSGWRQELKLCSRPQKAVPKKTLWRLQLNKACGTDGITNECLRHLPRRHLVHITHLFKQCFQLSHFPQPSKEAEVIALSKRGKDSKFPQNLRPISFLSTTAKLFKKTILKIFQRHVECNFYVQVSLANAHVTATLSNVWGLRTMWY
jgi:hypothetical protein